MSFLSLFCVFSSLYSMSFQPSPLCFSSLSSFFFTSSFPLSLPSPPLLCRPPFQSVNYNRQGNKSAGSSLAVEGKSVKINSPLPPNHCSNPWGWLGCGPFLLKSNTLGWLTLHFTCSVQRKALSMTNRRQYFVSFPFPCFL